MCPNYVSDGGKWSPAKESVSMKNTFGRTITSEFITANDGSHTVKKGENFLYNGPDREAVKELAKENLDHFGRDFRTHPEFLQAVRNMGFNDYKDYLKMINYDEKKAKEEFEAKASVINKHEAPERHKEAVLLAGGKEITASSNGENDLVGGFGIEKPRKVSEAKEQGAVVKRV